MRHTRHTSTNIAANMYSNLSMDLLCAESRHHLEKRGAASVLSILPHGWQRHIWLIFDAFQPSSLLIFITWAAGTWPQRKLALKFLLSKSNFLLVDSLLKHVERQHTYQQRCVGDNGWAQEWCWTGTSLPSKMQLPQFLSVWFGNVSLLDSFPH